MTDCGRAWRCLPPKTDSLCCPMYNGVAECSGPWPALILQYVVSLRMQPTLVFGALLRIAPSRVGDVPRIKEILLRGDASLGVNCEPIEDP